MKNKKILAFSPAFLPHMGGVERATHELYRRFVSQYNVRVVLITPKLEESPDYEIVDGIEVYRFSVPKNKLLKIILYQIKFLTLYVRNFKKDRFEILHLNYGFHLFLVSIIWKVILRKKLIVFEHHLGTGAEISDYRENPLLVNIVIGFVYRIADKIITISEPNKKFIKKFSGRDDVIILKQGTDHKFFTPERFDIETYEKMKEGFDGVACTTSRISPRKNIEDQIRAIYYLKRENIRVKLYINGKIEKGFEGYLERLKNLIKKYDLEEFVKFNGFVSDEELAKIYACSDLFLLTSKFEGFCIANTEAMACGTPSISYKVGAAYNSIYNFENGYVVESNSPEEMAEIIAKIIRDKDLLKKMSKKSREIVEKELNWDIYAKNNYRCIFE